MNANTVDNGKQEKNSAAVQPRPLRIVIAGGGTGGHLFPGIAIADELMTRNPENCILFMSTGNPFEKTVLSKTGYPLKAITAEGIKGRGILNQMGSALKIPRGIIESLWGLNQFRPNLVVGVGSYSAGPVVLGAWLIGIKIILHEQNIIPGITNRLLSRFAKRICVSFKETKSYFKSQKTHITGNPVRKEILQLVRGRQAHDAGKKKETASFRMLVFGGSQGAHNINLAVMKSLEFFKNKDAFFFVHQVGPQDMEIVKSAYRCQGVACTVKTFFTDMGHQYQTADLIICRAGATTIAEITAIGKGVIFIPFPFAADNHQELNARTLSDNGAAELILEKDLNGRNLAKRIEFYASNPEALSRMASSARSLGKPEAARSIVDSCYRLFEAA
jgi:UDP-N-acetylglucosamine--N-acetylmuramyl-(pentapeptide) pyrophosphoryl-undecaprenol N-acetylglucosamine transferase